MGNRIRNQRITITQTDKCHLAEGFGPAADFKGLFDKKEGAEVKMLRFSYYISTSMGLLIVQNSEIRMRLET